MTAAPLNNGLAKVRARLPVRIGSYCPTVILDRHDKPFCVVPNGPTAQATAELIRDAMNEMA